MSELCTTLFLAAILLAFFVGIISVALRYPVATVLGILCAGLFLGCIGQSEAATRFEVTAVIESEADRNTMTDAVAYASRIYKDQLDVELVVTAVEVSTVAGHTKAEALLGALQQYRKDFTTDAIVLFTRREMKGYAGIASVGPACGASAAAIVAIRNDGNDGQILAHELLHTQGVPHDAMPGYLMSEGISRYGSDTMSADSVRTFQAAGVDACMSIKPVAAAASTAPQAQPSNGGGGSSDGMLILVLLVIVIAIQARQLRNK